MPKRKMVNLGLRCTPEMRKRLRQVAAERETSLQVMFMKAMQRDLLASEEREAGMVNLADYPQDDRDLLEVFFFILENAADENAKLPLKILVYSLGRSILEKSSSHEKIPEKIKDQILQALFRYMDEHFAIIREDFKRQYSEQRDALAHNGPKPARAGEGNTPAPVPRARTGTT